MNANDTIVRAPWSLINRANSSINTNASMMNTMATGFASAEFSSAVEAKVTYRKTPFGTTSPKQARANKARSCDRVNDFMTVSAASRFVEDNVLRVDRTATTL